MRAYYWQFASVPLCKDITQRPKDKEGTKPRKMKTETTAVYRGERYNTESTGAAMIFLGALLIIATIATSIF